MQQKSLIDEKIADLRKQPCTPENTVKIEHLLSLNEELLKSMGALKRKSHILWPSSTMNCEHRSRKSIIDIVNKIENGEPLTIDQAKGIAGRSLLLDIQNFDFVYDSPAEYLHSGCLGVIKRTVELTFNVGSNRQRVTKRPLSCVSDFDKLMLVTKVVQEFSRRARKLDFAVFKGQEFRNLALFFFPLVIECIEQGANERSIWLNLAYMLRSTVIPSDEFSPINLATINESCAIVYKLFESTFGEINCSYNLHVFCSHLLEIRTHGPLTKTSAFKFESFYGELRRSFVPGTTSPVKQIMQNVLLKRILSKHYCENSIYISNYDTALECNNLIYCYNKKYSIYKVAQINENVAKCHKIGLYPATFDETPHVDWSKVGVFRKGGICSEITDINTSEICGKVLLVGKYLLTCPKMY